MGGDFNFGGGGGAGVQFDESVLYKIDETSGSKDMTSGSSENEHRNGRGYDDNDSSDQNLSESERKSVERWVSIGGGGGCGSCNDSNDDSNIKNDEIAEHDDADEQYFSEIITWNNSSNSNNNRPKGRSSNKDDICSQSKERIICGETEDEDSLSKSLNQTTVSKKIKSFFNVLSTSCDVLEVTGGGGGGGGTAECSSPYRVGYGFSFQINSSVKEDSLSSFSSSASILLMSRNNPTADYYPQNKNKNRVSMSNIISRRQEKAHDDNKYRNDIITTEPDADNVPYKPYEFDVAGGLLHSASVVCGGYMDWCCVTGHASKQIKACLASDVLSSDVVRIEVASASSNKFKMNDSFLTLRSGVLKVNEEKDEKNDEKKDEKENNNLRLSLEENQNDETEDNRQNDDVDDSSFSDSSSCSKIIAAKNRILWLLSVESSPSCKGSLDRNGNNENKNNDETKNDREKNDELNEGDKYVSYGWSQEEEKKKWFSDRNRMSQRENDYENENISCPDINRENGRSDSTYNRLLSCFHNKYNLNPDSRNYSNYYNNNAININNIDENISLITYNDKNKNVIDDSDSNRNNNMNIVSTDTSNKSILDLYNSNSLNWTTYSEELFAPQLYCANNAYVHEDLIFLRNDINSSQNGNGSENSVDLKICSSYRWINSTYENNIHQISEQFNLSNNENSRSKNININDTMIYESATVQFNSENPSMSILFYFFYLYFLLHIYLFFVKKLFGERIF